MDAVTTGTRMDYDSLFIDGAFVAAAHGTEEAITPIDGSAIGSAPVGSPDEARKALGLLCGTCTRLRREDHFSLPPMRPYCTIVASTSTMARTAMSAVMSEMS